MAAYEISSVYKLYVLKNTGSEKRIAETVYCRQHFPKVDYLILILAVLFVTRQIVNNYTFCEVLCLGVIVA